MAQAARNPDWVLGYADETWWTRLAQPNLSAWTDADVRLVLHQHDDAVAGRDPDLAKTAGDASRTPVQIAGAVPGALERDRAAVAVPLERLLREPREVVRSEGRSHAANSMLGACRKQ